MKKDSGLVLLVSFIGVAVLAGASLYFGAPLFGWLIIALIFLIYILALLRDYRLLKNLEVESKRLEEFDLTTAESALPSGFVSERFKAVKNLGSSLSSLSTQVSLELLNSRLAIKSGRHAGGAVIMLGLMGTFFGLMLSVSTAGSTIDNTSSAATMNSIHSIFSNMKGIFGTSLCGIFASLILSFVHSIVERRAEVFASDLDLWTISTLFPMFVLKSENPSQNMAESFEKALSLLESRFSSAMESQSKKMQDILEVVSEKTLQSEENAVSMVKGLVSELQTGISASMNAATKRVESLESGVGEELKQSVVNLTDNISNALLQQTKSASEEWNALLKRFADLLDSQMAQQDAKLKTLQESSGEISDTLKTMVGQVVESNSQKWEEFFNRLDKKTEEAENFQREGIKTLSEVAVQVAEKAAVGSSELSSKVTQEIQKLSSEVQQSFSSLSAASSALVESQGRLISEIENRVVRENEASANLAEGITEAAGLMHVNQSEFAAGLEMFNKGLEALFEKLSGETEEKEEGDLLDQIRASLELFHERASEILVENAVKTQEILLEILEQTQRTAHLSEQHPEA